MDHLASGRLGLPQVLMDWGADITPTKNKKGATNRERRSFKGTETGYGQKAQRGQISFRKLTRGETCTVQMQNDTKTQKKLFLLRRSREIMGTKILNTHLCCYTVQELWNVWLA